MKVSLQIHPPQCLTFVYPLFEFDYVRIVSLRRSTRGGYAQILAEMERCGGGAKPRSRSTRSVRHCRCVLPILNWICPLLKYKFSL